MEFIILMKAHRIPLSRRRGLLREWDGLACFPEDRRYIVEDIQETGRPLTVENELPLCLDSYNAAMEQ